MNIDDVRKAVRRKDRYVDSGGLRYVIDPSRSIDYAILLHQTLEGVGMLSKSYIQGFDPCNVGLEDLQLFVVQLKPLAESQDLNFEWLQEKFTAATSELNMRQRDEDRRRLKELEMEEDALQSRQEKREKLRAEMEKLQAKLGMK